MRKPKLKKMKGKFILFSLMIALFVIVKSEAKAQNLLNNPGLETWTNATTPTGWDKAESVTQESTTVHGGTYSAKQQAGTKDLTQNLSGILPGGSYTISYWFLDNDPAARSRIYSYWLDGTSTLGSDNGAELRPSTYSSNNPTWQEYTVTIDAPQAADGFRFEVRSYNEGTGSGYIYYDDFSVVYNAPVYCSEVLEFSFAEQSGPAVIDTINNTIDIEVYAGTDLAKLVPVFTLCTNSNAIDTAAQSIITTGIDTVDFSSTVVWMILGETPAQFYEINVTVAQAPAPSIIINEFDYDQDGTDVGEFIELMNNGTVPVNLLGMRLQVVSSNFSLYRDFALLDTTIQPNAYYVICGDAANVDNCDYDISPDKDVIPNSGPRAIALVDGSSNILDVVSFEGSVVGFVEGSGVIPYDNNYDVSYGLSRIPNGLDTDDNSVDFDGVCITPGMPNAYDVMPCVCTITNVSVGNVSACDSADNTYSYFVTVDYVKDPGTGTLDINGESFAITTSPQTIEVTGVPSDGLVRDLNVEFSANTSCSWYDDSVFTAPIPCIECIDTVRALSISPCEPTTNTYSVALEGVINIYYPGEWVVQAGNVTDTIVFQQTPVAVKNGLGIINGLIADGNPVDVTIYNLNNPGCVGTFEDVWVAPVNCYSPPSLVINEVDYDQPSLDGAEFIELKNNEEYPINLENFKLELINGSNSFVYDEIYLPSFVLAPGDYYVICLNPETTPNCDLDMSEHSNNYNSLFSIQNGHSSSLTANTSPDAVALYSPFGDTLDRLCYEGSFDPYVEGSGDNLADDASYAGNGLSRYPDGIDTDMNNADFEFKCITPGESNSYLSQYCGPFHTASFTAFYQNATAPIAMPDVLFSLILDGDTLGQQISDQNGEVVFDSIHNDSYQLAADLSHYKWGWGGVNALDALLIALHSVNLSTIPQPYLAVADVNSDAVANATDALRVSQRFAGIVNSFNAGDWYQTNVNYNFFNDVDSSFQLEFPLLCFGDVNGSHIPVGATKASNAVLENSGEIMLTEGSLDIPVSLKYAAELGAVSLVLDIPASVSVQGITMADGSEAAYTIQNNVLTLSWFSMYGMDVDAGGQLLSISARVNGSLESTSFDVLPGSEFGDVSGEKIEAITLLIPAITDAKATVAAYPNPANNNTTLSYSVPKSGLISIEILDVLGAKVRSISTGYQSAGNYTQEIDLSDLAEGTYLIRLNSDDFQSSGRILIVR